MSSTDGTARPVASTRRNRASLRDVALLAVAVAFVALTVAGLGPRPAENVVAAVTAAVR